MSNEIICISCRLFKFSFEFEPIYSHQFCNGSIKIIYFSYTEENDGKDGDDEEDDNNDNACRRSRSSSSNRSN